MVFISNAVRTGSQGLRFPSSISVLFAFDGRSIQKYVIVCHHAQQTVPAFPTVGVLVRAVWKPLEAGGFWQASGVCWWRLPWHSLRSLGFLADSSLQSGSRENSSDLGGRQWSPQDLITDKLASEFPYWEIIPHHLNFLRFHLKQLWLLVEIISQKVFWFFGHN